MFGFLSCCSNSSNKVQREPSFISINSDIPSDLSFLEMPSTFSNRPRPNFADYYDKDIPSFMHQGTNEISFEQARPKNKTFILGENYKIIAKITSWKISEVLEVTDVPSSYGKLTSSETSFDDMISGLSIKSDLLDDKIKNEYLESKTFINELEKLSCSSPDNKGVLKEIYKEKLPNNVSKYLAQRLKCDSIIDAFCEHGEITIQLAKSCQFVTAICSNPKKAEISMINSRIHRVNHKIDFIVGDLSHIKNKHADIVFLNPQNTFTDHTPTKKSKQQPNSAFSLFKHLKPDLLSAVTQSFKISQKIALKLPWYTDPNEIAELFHLALAQLKTKRYSIEIEEILNSNEEADYLLVYFGDCSSVKDFVTPYLISLYKIDVKEELQAFNEFLCCPKSATINSYYSNLVIAALIEKLGYLKCIDYAEKALENENSEAPPLQRFIDLLIGDNIFTLESITKLAKDEIAKHSSKLLSPKFNSQLNLNIYDLLFTAAFNSQRNPKEDFRFNPGSLRLSQDSQMIDAHSFNKTKNNYYGDKIKDGTIKESHTVSELAISSYSVASNYLDDYDDEEDRWDESRSRRVSQVNLSASQKKAIHLSLYSHSLDKDLLK